MSYDILFVPRRPGQTWESALDEAEGRDVLEEAVRPERLAQFDRVVAALRARVGDVVVTVDDDTCEATHPNGLILALYPDEASVSFPYRHREDAAAFHDVIVDVVGILERETGLHAWDAQTDEPFDGRVHDQAGLAGTRGLAQETSDVSGTEAMAARADVGPDTGPVPVAPLDPSAPAAGPLDDAAARLARERRRSLVYVVTGVLIVTVVLGIDDGSQPSTLGGVAIVIGVFNVVLGGLTYLGASRRAAGRG